MKVRKNCDRFKCDFKWKNVKKENGNVKKKNPKQKKCLQKDWSWWNRHLKALAQTSRTCISTEALKHTDPLARWPKGPLDGALPGNREKWWLFLSCWVPTWEESHQLCLEEMQKSSKLLSFYLEWKWEGRVVPGFSWVCSMQVHLLWSKASCSLFFA